MLRKIQIAESAKSHKHAKLIAEASQTLEDAVAAADLQLLGPVLEGVWRERDPLRHTHTHTNTTARSHAPSLLSPPSFISRRCDERIANSVESRGRRSGVEPQVGATTELGIWVEGCA